LTVTFPKWTIDHALLERACYPERAKEKAKQSAADMMRAYVAQKGVKVEAGTTVEVDGVKFLFG
jgi:hypothetical protein